MDLFNKQLQLFWRPEEIELKKDRNDFKLLAPHEQFIFTSNLKFQTMLDSVISRGVITLLPHVSNPELEACFNVWQMFETIHSYAYSYIIQNVYPNPNEVMDSVLKDKHIVARADSAVQAYDDLMFCEPKNMKEQIYLTLVAINILEALRFYVSFVCAFAFGENKRMIGNADIIKLIKRDEAQHVAITQSIIKILRNDSDEGFQKTILGLDDKVVEMFDHAVKEEIKWAEYLFKDGPLLGLNLEILSQYIESLADARLSTLGLDKVYNTKNPIGGWLDHWMSSEGEQVAPQESEITQYRISASKDDLSGSFSNFEL
jgi:ribonucleoside-diphosphate reductase beta chain